ncbi:FAD-dependent monooxygenase [Aliamphritea ceti]|uniref:FAD-dependent monooxygenase n=1 Tax=Aliamphritea ceti TaxID=1524258 RepID=UPI0021C37F93|nr:FAD-dependent monooxygenase [Aliamphritea ceti]
MTELSQDQKLQQKKQPQQQADQVDIAIVGAGMVGMTLACLLADSGLTVRVIEARNSDRESLISAEQQQRSDAFDNRVSALTIASQQILQSTSAWPLMQQMRITPYTRMDVWDGEGSGNIQFNSHELQEEYLGHIVENRVTLAALYQASLAMPAIEWQSGSRLTGLSEIETDNNQQLRTLSFADGSTLKAGLVIAADGAMSNTRRLADLPMWEWDYGHHAIVTTVKVADGHQHTCWQRFTDDGPLAFLPVSDLAVSGKNDQHCSIVWSTSPDHAAELMTLDDDAFCRALEHAIEGRLGNVTAAQPRMSVPLRQRHASRYVQAGFAAIGDAAHTIHPLAGQGVNLGLLDAAVLAEVILDAQAAGEMWQSEYVLHRYQRQRQGENLKMAASMEGFKRLFATDAAVPRLLRNVGMSLMNKTPMIKNHVVQQAMGLSGNLPRFARRS